MSAALELVPEIPERTLCTAAGISRSTLRRRRYGAPERPQSAISRRRWRRALSEQERAEVLAVLHSERFADRAPATIYATLLDEGVYLCSISTMYRLLRANEEVRERRRIARHPEYQKPELLATAPRQVMSWDITKLRGPNKGEWFALRQATFTEHTLRLWKCMLVVVKSLIWMGCSGRHGSEPKTKGSRRLIDLGPIALASLRKHLKAATAEASSRANRAVKGRARRAAWNAAKPRSVVIDVPLVLHRGRATAA